MTGPESLSIRQRVATIAEVIGRSIENLELTPAQARERMTRFLPADAADIILGHLEEAPAVAPTAPAPGSVLGRDPTTYRDWVTGQRAVFDPRGRRPRSGPTVRRGRADARRTTRPGEAPVGGCSTHGDGENFGWVGRVLSAEPAQEDLCLWSWGRVVVGSHEVVAVAHRDGVGHRGPDLAGAQGGAGEAFGQQRDGFTLGGEFDRGDRGVDGDGPAGGDEVVGVPQLLPEVLEAQDLYARAFGEIGHRTDRAVPAFVLGAVDECCGVGVQELGVAVGPHPGPLADVDVDVDVADDVDVGPDRGDHA